MLKEPATKITKFIASSTSPVIENDESVWIYGMLFVNSDPSFPATLLINAGPNQDVIRTISVPPAASYEFEVPYLSPSNNLLSIALFSGGPVTVYLFHSSGGV